MIIDRVKIKAVLTAVALSVNLGFDCKYMVSRDYDEYIRGTNSLNLQESQKIKNLELKIYGDVPVDIIQSAKTILNNDLLDVVRSNLTEQCHLAIIEDKQLADFYENKLDFNLSEAVKTGKIKGRENDKTIRLYCPSSRVNELLPQMVHSLNAYFLSNKVG
jgi:hypothetical protein